MRLLETISQIASDAIAMALQHAESETRALTDPMTELPNARSLQLQFEKEVARASRNGSNFQLLMLDLDGFKSVNDNLRTQSRRPNAQRIVKSNAGAIARLRFSFSLCRR